MAAGSAAAVVIGLVLMTRGDESPSVRAGPPAPVPALQAERVLERRFGRAADDETAAVRCPYRIEPRQLVRCELRYADGIARAMFVWLTRSGNLGAEIPYPATLRR